MVVLGEESGCQSGGDVFGHLLNCVGYVVVGGVRFMDHPVSFCIVDGDAEVGALERVVVDDDSVSGDVEAFRFSLRDGELVLFEKV